MAISLANLVLGIGVVPRLSNSKHIEQFALEYVEIVPKSIEFGNTLVRIFASPYNGRCCAEQP